MVGSCCAIAALVLLAQGWQTVEPLALLGREGFSQAAMQIGVRPGSHPGDSAFEHRNAGQDDLGCGSAPKRDPAYDRIRRCKLMEIRTHRGPRSAPIGIPGAALLRTISNACGARRRGPTSTPIHSFWVHRVLEAEGIESHVVDPASIAVSRRKRRIKTDRIDGEMLVLEHGGLASAQRRNSRSSAKSARSPRKSHPDRAPNRPKSTTLQAVTPSTSLRPPESAIVRGALKS